MSAFEISDMQEPISGIGQLILGPVVVNPPSWLLLAAHVENFSSLHPCTLFFSSLLSCWENATDYPSDNSDDFAQNATTTIRQKMENRKEKERWEIFPFNPHTHSALHTFPKCFHSDGPSNTRENLPRSFLSTLRRTNANDYDEKTQTAYSTIQRWTTALLSDRFEG